MIDQAQRRLLVALGASVLAHAWLVHHGDLPGSRRIRTVGGAANDVPITAKLLVPAVDAAAPIPQARHATVPEPRVTTDSDFRRGPLSAMVRVAPAAQAAQSALATAEAAKVTALTQPSDPTYYAARQLDV